MPPTLYHVPKTISSPLVQILLELGIVKDNDTHKQQKNVVFVQELSFADLKSEHYKKMNPMGTSPTFRDGDLDITMWESGAILDHLLEQYDVNNRFYPPPATPVPVVAEGLASTTPELQQQQIIKARCKYLQLKQYILATVYPFIASMYIHSLRNKGEGLDEEYMKSAQEKCHTVLGPVMTKWLGDGPYFLGDDISAVDFLAIKPLGNVKSLGLLSEFPQLEALYDRISNRPTYRPAYESGGMKAAKVAVVTATTGPNDQTIVMVPNKKPICAGNNNNNNDTTNAVVVKTSNNKVRRSRSPTNNAKIIISHDDCRRDGGGFGCKVDL